MPCKKNSGETSLLPAASIRLRTYTRRNSTLCQTHQVAGVQPRVCVRAAAGYFKLTLTAFDSWPLMRNTKSISPRPNNSRGISILTWSTP